MAAGRHESSSPYPFGFNKQRHLHHQKQRRVQQVNRQHGFHGCVRCKDTSILPKPQLGQDTGDQGEIGKEGPVRLDHFELQQKDDGRRNMASRCCHVHQPFELLHIEQQNIIQFELGDLQPDILYTSSIHPLHQINYIPAGANEYAILSSPEVSQGPHQ